ncbi:MAG: hypothetical protein IKI35_05585 [Stomatobaculum sp.]|nr:hypothetical protein [Stomatobaculum sp.]MBR7058180.1 hypothetical protein [Stomatobaculum sp.]
MKTYYDEHGDLIEDPAAALADNVYVYSTRRGDFIFPIEHRLPLIAAEEKEGDAHVPAQE